MADKNMVNTEKNENTEPVVSNFIYNIIDKDIADQKHGGKVCTRFPPEPNGYLHIGHAKAICLNFGTALKYGGKCNLRFDDTNPVKEDTEYVESIEADVRWLGFQWDELFFASEYFDKMYECAVKLIKKGKAFVCDLTAEEMKEYRGTLTKPGTESPYRTRSVEENLDLFERMKNGEFKDGEKVLRAKIDMASPNINMRDPALYRISHSSHHKTGDKWCIYPMYDFAHPLEDAIEGITHSICTLEFEDHRPLYDWVLRETEWENPPQQMEFARLNLTDTLMSKRYLKALVENKQVDGWDDPRMPTIAGLRRRGYTPASIRDFCDRIGISKANSVVDMGLLEHCVREDLKEKTTSKMVVMEPLKVTIQNYPEGECEWLEIENSRDEAMGTRKVPFTKTLYVDKADFMEVPVKGYFRLFPGNEVRFKGAYFIKCEDVVKDADGEVVELICSYDPETRSGTSFTGRKVKGTIHWVDAANAVDITVNAYDTLMKDNEQGESVLNLDSLTVYHAKAEPAVLEMKVGERCQFFRHGYYIRDEKQSTPENQVFTRIVDLKSSWKK